MSLNLTEKIVLKYVKLKSDIGNNKERTVTEKNDKTPCYIVFRTHFSPESPIDGSISRSRNNKERTVTEKNDKTPYYLVIRTHFSPQSSIDGSTFRYRNSRNFLPLPLGIPLIVTVEPSAPHLHKLHEQNKRQMTIRNCNSQSAKESHSGCKISQ